MSVEDDVLEYSVEDEHTAQVLSAREQRVIGVMARPQLPEMFRDHDDSMEPGAQTTRAVKVAGIAPAKVVTTGYGINLSALEVRAIPSGPARTVEIGRPRAASPARANLPDPGTFTEPNAAKPANKLEAVAASASRHPRDTMSANNYEAIKYVNYKLAVYQERSAEREAGSRTGSNAGARENASPRSQRSIESVISTVRNDSDRSASASTPASSDASINEAKKGRFAQAFGRMKEGFESLRNNVARLGESKSAVSLPEKPTLNAEALAKLTSHSATEVRAPEPGKRPGHAHSESIQKAVALESLQVGVGKVSESGIDLVKAAQQAQQKRGAGAEKPMRDLQMARELDPRPEVRGR